MQIFGRCECCTGHVETTAGCTLCNSSKTYCGSCGALTKCGCGKEFSHDCNGAVVITGTNVVPVGIVVPTGFVVPPRPTFASILPEGFITETGKLLN